MTTNTNTNAAMNSTTEDQAFEDWYKKYCVPVDASAKLSMRYAWCAAIASAAQPPAGWVLVPVEPTEEMIAHAHQACDGTYAGDVYHAMLAAAPRGDTPATNPDLLDFKTLMADSASTAQQPEQTRQSVGLKGIEGAIK